MSSPPPRNPSTTSTVVEQYAPKFLPELLRRQPKALNFILRMESQHQQLLLAGDRKPAPTPAAGAAQAAVRTVGF